MNATRQIMVITKVSQGMGVQVKSARMKKLLAVSTMTTDRSSINNRTTGTHNCVGQHGTHANDATVKRMHHEGLVPPCNQHQPWFSEHVEILEYILYQGIQRLMLAFCLFFIQISIPNALLSL